ncbi:hypothetical protein ACLOJK_014372 [Asimina triloba]
MLASLNIVQSKDVATEEKAPKLEATLQEHQCTTKVERLKASSAPQGATSTGPLEKTQVAMLREYFNS